MNIHISHTSFSHFIYRNLKIDNKKHNPAKQV